MPIIIGGFHLTSRNYTLEIKRKDSSYLLAPYSSGIAEQNFLMRDRAPSKIITILY